MRSLARAVDGKLPEILLVGLHNALLIPVCSNPMLALRGNASARKTGVNWSQFVALL